MYINIITRVYYYKSVQIKWIAIIGGGKLTKNYIIIDLHKEIIFEEHVADYGKQVNQNESQDCCQYY